MKNIHKYLLCFLILISCMIETVIGQENWRDFLSSTNNYFEATQNIDAWFKENGKDNQYKHYMRWKGEMQYHVNVDGSIPNINLNRFNEFKKISRANNNRSTNGNWENIGPFDYADLDTWSGGGIGRINCMAFHPTNNNIFWIGAANGGLWKTIDAGVTWTVLTDGLPTLGISGIVINETNPNIIYILTGDGDGSGLNASETQLMRQDASIGVLKSIDGGLSWSQTGLQFTSSETAYGYDMVAQPGFPNRILVAMGGRGLYRTTNAGSTWSHIDSTRVYWDLEFSQSLPDLAFAATDDGLMRSLSGGSNWAVADIIQFPNSFSRMAIALSPSEQSSVYALFGGAGSAGTFSGLFKSEDFGASFTLKSTTPNILDPTNDGGGSQNQATYDLCITVDPIDDSQIFVGAINMWKSLDEGVTWSRETWWTRNFEPIDPYVHADWHNLYFQDNTLFGVTDGGIAKSADYGNDWAELTAGMSTTMIYELATLGDNYMTGTQDNGTHQGLITTTSTGTIGGGDGFGCTWHSGDNSIQFFTSQDRLARRQFGSNLFIWEEGNGFWYTDLKMHTTDPNYLFFDKGNELFRANQDGGPTNFFFDSLKTNGVLSGNQILGYRQGSGASDEIMYVINQNAIIKTSNLSFGAPPWAVLTNPAQFSAPLSDVEISPTDPNKVWLSCSGYQDTSKVFYSNNGGLSWENISDGLPAVPTRCLLYQPGSNDVMYIGTDLGVYYRRDGMSEWEYYGNGLPGTTITDLDLTSNQLIASTFGRGVWKTDLISNCQNTIVLTPQNQTGDPNQVGKEVHRASNNILSNRLVPASVGTDIRYFAGSHTDLFLGFEARRGAFFEVKTGDCPQ